jgi:hypothetical protein
MNEEEREAIQIRAKKHAELRYGNSEFASKREREHRIFECEFDYSEGMKAGLQMAIKIAEIQRRSNTTPGGAETVLVDAHIKITGERGE